jgi:hypothetical protein
MLAELNGLQATSLLHLLISKHGKQMNALLALH